VNVRCIKCGELKFTTEVHFIHRGMVEGAVGIKRYEAECRTCFVKPEMPPVETHWQETDNDT